MSWGGSTIVRSRSLARTTGAEPDAMAGLLLGACFQRAFLITFSGETPSSGQLSALAARLVATVLEPTASAAGT